MLSRRSTDECAILPGSMPESNGCSAQMVRRGGQPLLQQPYRLEDLTPEEVSRWDELIAPYDGREVFHRRAWLDYLAATRCVQLRFWKIQDDEGTLGFFCGAIARKGPYRILGSPLRGWGTNFMGPVMKTGADQHRFVAALDSLARRDRLAIVEIEYPTQPDDLLEKARYESTVSWTYWVDLTPGDEDAMLARMDKSRRYGIRRAIKGGLLVEEADDRISDEYCDLFSDVMLRKGLALPYPRSYVSTMYEKLTPAGYLFSLRVKDSDGHLLAAGLFPHDDRTMYFWGGASSVEGKRLYASDLLHWRAMTLAAERGLVRYDLSGWGRFKKEFGGTLITLKRWHKSYSRTARWARRGYEFYFRKRARLYDWVTNIRARENEPGEAQTD